MSALGNIRHTLQLIFLERNVLISIHIYVVSYSLVLFFLLRISICCSKQFRICRFQECGENSHRPILGGYWSRLAWLGNYWWHHTTITTSYSYTTNSHFATYHTHSWGWCANEWGQSSGISHVSPSIGAWQFVSLVWSTWWCWRLCGTTTYFYQGIFHRIAGGRFFSCCILCPPREEWPRCIHEFPSSDFAHATPDLPGTTAADLGRQGVQPDDTADLARADGWQDDVRTSEVFRRPFCWANSLWKTKCIRKFQMNTFFLSCKMKMQYCIFKWCILRQFWLWQLPNRCFFLGNWTLKLENKRLQ